MVLVCSVPVQPVLSVFPWVYRPFVCVPWRDVCSHLGLISKLGYVVFNVELRVLSLDLSPSPEQRFAGVCPILWMVFFTSLMVLLEAQKL